jgi:hypothetical protein
MENVDVPVREHAQPAILVNCMGPAALANHGHYGSEVICGAFFGAEVVLSQVSY